ncbi:TadE/TadG family type IV pilus assembly protein [Rhodovulum euryhalinum]|uniref:TadE-like protein n=1 Tax=Rhodovulum euryhalinum TaxID=35805 RepID=A0A4R2KK85_9RHOB|nr:TadE/TadG family type IV pilus assembly protein [Rhodovulum euryhalinum]TCO72867.1 TadE-like protein [Rhodovulum euryhalinum]
MTPLFRLTARLIRAIRREDGTASIEFVLTFPIVFSMFLMSLESSILMTRQMLLDHALDESMRGIRLGQYPGLDHDMFKDIICSQAHLFPDCPNVIRVELTPVSKTTWNLPDAAATCVDRSAPIQPVTNFAQGPQNSLMMVRACVVVDPFFPGVGLGLRLHEDPRDGYALVATSAFVNEPGAGI